MHVSIGRKPALSVEREKQIFDWLKLCAQQQRSPALVDILARVQRLGLIDGVKFTGRRGMPTKRWYAGYKKRWNIRILKQRRHTPLPPFEEQVRAWFKLFYEHAILKKRDKCYNYDEVGYSRFDGPQWVCVAAEDYLGGTRPSVAAPEWHDHITLAACCGANCSMIPNLWILKGQSEQKYPQLAAELPGCYIVTSG